MSVKTLLTFLSCEMFDGQNSKPALSLEIFLEHFYSLRVSISIVFPLQRTSKCLRTSYQKQHYYFQNVCSYHGTELITLFWSYRVAFTNRELLELPKILFRWKKSPGENNWNSELYKNAGNSFHERLLLFLIKC